MTDNNNTTIWVCQGPPICNLQDDDAVRAQENGCVWCKRIVIDEYGNEQVFDIGHS